MLEQQGERVLAPSPDPLHHPLLLEVALQPSPASQQHLAQGGVQPMVPQGLTRPPPRSAPSAAAEPRAGDE